MKTNKKNLCIETMVSAFNAAATVAGFTHKMAYLETKEKIVIDEKISYNKDTKEIIANRQEKLSIDLRMNSERACFRDIIRGLYRIINKGEAYNG